MSVVYERNSGTEHRSVLRAPSHPSLLDLDDAVRRHPERVGRGGTGSCFRVSTREGMRVLKVLEAPSPALRGRLRRDVDLVANTTHDALVPIHAVTERDGRLLFLRDWVEGPSLADVLESRRALPLVEAAPIIRRVAEGLRALHQRGLSHREVKPGHVLLGPAGAMLIDAGLPSYDESYVPPEWLSLKLSTTRSDLWQLGALAVHVLCGSPPSKGGVLPRATPEPLQTVVQRLLSMDPAARPPSVRPVLDVLAAIRDADDVEEEVSGLVLVDDVRTATQSTPPPLPVKKAQIVVPEESTDALMVPVGFASVRAAWLEGIRRAWASIQRTWRSLPWASTRWRTTLSLERLRARLR